jgi:hypothetical protein
MDSHLHVLVRIDDEDHASTNKGQAFFVDQHLFLGYDVARWDD